MAMGCWTSSCHMESPWLSHCLSSGEIRYALTSGPLAPGLVVLTETHVCIRAQEPGLAGQHDGEPRTWKHLSSQLEGPLPGEPLARRTTSGRTPCSPSAFAMGTWPQTLPYSFLAFPPPRHKLCPRSSSFSLLLFSFSPHLPLPHLLVPLPPLLTSFPAFLPHCSMPPWLTPATFLPPGLQQQLVACGTSHPVRGLCQGRQGCTLHQEEWGAPTDH